MGSVLPAAGVRTPNMPRIHAPAIRKSPVAPEPPLPPDLAAALHRVDDLVQRFETHPDPAVQACATELLQCVDAVHRAGIRQLAGLLSGAGLAERALVDPAIALLFELYGLVEDQEPVAL